MSEIRINEPGNTGDFITFTEYPNQFILRTFYSDGALQVFKGGLKEAEQLKKLLEGFIQNANSISNPKD